MFFAIRGDFNRDAAHTCRAFASSPRRGTAWATCRSRSRRTESEHCSGATSFIIQYKYSSPIGIRRSAPTARKLRNRAAGYSNLAIQVSSQNTPQQYEALREGSLDGGIVYAFGDTPPGIRTIVLAKHEVVLAVPNDWALARRSSVSLDELREIPIVLFPRHVYPAYYDTLRAPSSPPADAYRAAQGRPVHSSCAIAALLRANSSAARHRSTPCFPSARRSADL
ncbi:LysR substrate-binding domain-containing protein [Trinickia dinghuensis]|uniref:LysR substrate-binding domain-containing protein n=1 Tax=Trinickia dinghuensis TaxID=2291023 RepID=A0A3D8JXM9_9BURK|nr:hypothetical protein DWV00_17355 [Trinickia dinghuensis]